MDAGPGLAPIVLAAVAGGMVAVAAREAVLATPAVARWLAEAVDPLRRAGREGYLPTESERRRLGVVGTAGLLALATGLQVAGFAAIRSLSRIGPEGR